LILGIYMGLDKACLFTEVIRLFCKKKHWILIEYTGRTVSPTSEVLDERHHVGTLDNDSNDRVWIFG